MTETNWYDPGTGNFIVVDGLIVERDAQNIVDRVREYDPNLDVMCLDPAMGDGLNDAPFLLIWKRPSDGAWERVFEFWALDERVLERIYNADQTRFSAMLKIEDMEAAIEKANKQRYQEFRDEAKEVMLAAVVNKSSSFSLINKEGDLVKIHEDAPRTLNKGKRSFSDAGNKFNVKG